MAKIGVLKPIGEKGDDMSDPVPEIELVLEDPPRSPLSLNEHLGAEAGGATRKKRFRMEKLKPKMCHLPFQPSVGSNGQTRAAGV